MDISESLHKKKAISLQKELFAAQENARRLRLDLNASNTEVRQVRTTLNKLESNHKELIQKLEGKHAEVEKHRKDIFHYQELCKVFKLDLDSQNLTNNSYDADIARFGSFIKKQKQELEKSRKLLSQSEYRRKQTEKSLLLQENETKIYQRRYEKVVDELQTLSASKTVLQLQWQNALQAMSKRDIVLEQAESMRREAVETVQSMFSKKGNIGQAMSTLKTENEMKDSKISQLEKKLFDTLNNLGTALKKEKHLEKILKLYQKEAQIDQKNAIELQRQIIFQQNQAKSNGQVKDIFKDKYEVEKDKVNALKREAANLEVNLTQGLREATQMHMAEAKRLAAEHIEMKNQLSKRNTDFIELKVESERTLKDNEQLRKTNKNLEKENSELSKILNEFKKKFLYKEYAINKLQGQNLNEVYKEQNMETRVGEIELQDKITKLKGRLQIIQTEYERSEEKALKLQKEKELLRAKLCRRDQRAGLEAVKAERASKDIETLNKTINESYVQQDIRKIEIQKANEKAFRLQNSNTILQAKLNNLKSNAEIMGSEANNQLHHLKTRLNIARKGEAESMKGRIEAETDKSHLKIRIESQKEVIRRLEKRLAESEEKICNLGREVFEKQKAIKSFKKIEKQLNEETKKSLNKGDNGNGFTKKSGNQACQSCIEFRKVTTKLAHSETIQERMRIKMDNCSLANHELEKNTFKLMKQLEEFEKQNKDLKEYQSYAVCRIERAENICSGLEQQLKQKYPDSSIQYLGHVPTMTLSQELKKALSFHLPQQKTEIGKENDSPKQPDLSKKTQDMVSSREKLIPSPPSADPKRSKPSSPKMEYLYTPRKIG